MSRRGRLFRGLGRIDKGLHGRRGQDDACRHEPDNLVPRQRGQIRWMDHTYRHVIGMGTANDGDDDANDAKEHEHRRPPDVIWKGIVPARAQVCKDASDKGNDPGELPSVSIPIRNHHRDHTHDGDGDGGERERIPEQIPQAHATLAASPPTASAGVHGAVHLPERGRMRGWIRWHRRVRRNPYRPENRPGGRSRFKGLENVVDRRAESWWSRSSLSRL